MKIVLTVLVLLGYVWECKNALIRSKTGEFTIAVDTNLLPSISVTHTDTNGMYKPVFIFESQNFSTHFLNVKMVKNRIEQASGDFVYNREIQYECSTVVIEKVQIHKHVNNNNNLKDDVLYDVVSVSGDLCDQANYNLTFQAIQPSNKSLPQHIKLNFTIEKIFYDFNTIKLFYSSMQDECYYGFGHQYTVTNMNGRFLPIFTSEQGVGRGEEGITELVNEGSKLHNSGGNWHTTYTQLPLYHSSFNYSLLIDSWDPIWFDFTAKEFSSVEAETLNLVAYLFNGDSILSLLPQTTLYTGRMQAPPDWSHSGAILGLEGGTDSVLQRISQVQKLLNTTKDIAAVWLQDWSGLRNFSGKGDLDRVGLWWNWEVDGTLYKDWDNMTQLLQKNGIRVLTYINCLLVDITARGTPYQRNLYKEAKDNGYFVKLGDGSNWEGYSTAGLIDLSNNDAYDWLKQIIIKNMLGTGASGWMLDFGESAPFDAVLKSNLDAKTFHGMFPYLWAKLNHEAVYEAQQQGIIKNASDIVYFMRSASMGTAKHTNLMWMGDQNVKWDQFDGLQSAMIGMLTGGLSGLTITHSDIGGYTSLPTVMLRTRELLLRWCELSAFSLMYRTHPGTLPDKDYQFYTDNETMSHFFNMSRLFQAWFFYRKQLIMESQETGIPILRPMFLHYTNLQQASEDILNKQFLVGTEILVAPVLSAAHTDVSVHIPYKTTWMHLWSDNVYTGNNVEVKIDAPIGKPCVLYKKGSQIGERFRENVDRLIGL